MLKMRACIGEFKQLLKHTLLGNVYNIILLNRFRRKWYKKTHNPESIPMNIFPIDCVEIGRGSYGELNVITFGHKTKLQIGNYVSIAQNVSFMLDVEHHTDHIFTYPFKVKMLKTETEEAFSKGDIIVEDDVWIGYGSIIMSGVRIGKGSIIAAGSVVTKDVPAYSIVGGVPAHKIRDRISKEVTSVISDINYDCITPEIVGSNIQLLYTKVSEINKEKIIEFCKKLKL